MPRNTFRNTQAAPMRDVDQDPPDWREGVSYEVRLRRPVEWPEGSGQHVRPDAAAVVIDGGVARLWGDAIGAYREA